MKGIIKIIIILVVVIVGWWLISPLFINQNVNEELPVGTQEDRELSDPGATLEMESDIIIGQDVVMDEPMMEMDETQKQSTELIGTFVDGERNYQGEGDVLLVSDGDSKFLRFENFSVTNGPDLFVTLNKGSDPKGEHVIVEALKGNQGNQNYDISEYDLSEYQSISIYCRAFSREFATAQL